MAHPESSVVVTVSYGISFLGKGATLPGGDTEVNNGWKRVGNSPILRGVFIYPPKADLVQQALAAGKAPLVSRAAVAVSSYTDRDGVYAGRHKEGSDM